jgi:uncharacterized RDD family membrane protein YckC
LPSWKEEVNQRLAAHKNRKGIAVVSPSRPAKKKSTAPSRAAEAAARVAARYAHTPSFSEMQAAEARAALRAAGVATRAALEAQAAAEAALDNLEAAQSTGEDEVAASGHSEDAAQEVVSGYPTTTPAAATSLPLEVRWEPDLPVRNPVPPIAPTAPELEELEAAKSDDRDPTQYRGALSINHAIEVVEPAQPIYANLLEFPRELVATRRVRPRLTSAPTGTGAELYGQLSIFEVDPSTISTEPEAEAAVQEASAASWSGPEWSNIELDSQPLEYAEAPSETPLKAPAVQQAPFELRLLAALVDAALVAGVFWALVWAIAGHISHPVAMKTAEIGAVATLILLGAAYQALFILLAGFTPGMKYAHIALCTFDDENPTQAQLRFRLWSQLVSLLPVGLGVVWAVFDDEGLSWHDRLSRTYQRRY